MIENSTYSQFDAAASPGPAPAGKGRIHLDAATQTFKRSENGGPSLDLGILQEFVYRPGEPSPSGNVYASWAALVAAVALVPGALGVKAVSLDDSISPIDLPPGAWNFGSYTILQSGRRSVLFPMVVTIEDGCTLVGIFDLVNLSITSLSTTFVIDVPSADHPTYLLRENTQIDQTVPGATFFRVASPGNAIFWFFGVSAFSGAELCLDVQAAGATVFLVGNDVGRVNQDTVAAVTGSTVRALIFTAGPNFDENQAGLVDSAGILPKFLLPKSTNVSYDDFLVSPSLNLTVANTIQAAVDQLKSQPFDDWTYSGKLDGAATPTGGYSLDLGPLNNQLSQVAVRHPRGSPSGEVEIYFYIHSNSLATNADFVLYVDGVATAIALSVIPGFTGPIAIVATVLAIVVPNGIDLRVDTAAGGIGNSISWSTTVRFMP
jgi:hypothetical protein